MSRRAPKRVLVVGASAAGVFTAEALRRHGYGGEIVVVGDEPPYDRPPLSKQVLKGDWTPERAVLMPPARFGAIDARFITDKRATALELAAQRVVFADGGVLEFDDLVVATGVRPRKLPGSDGAGAHVLRTTGDAVRLHEAIVRHREVLIIGAGFIGLEVAATAMALGARVRLIEPFREPLASRIGRHAAARLLRRHEQEGVQVRLGVGVRELRREGTASVVALDQGDELEAPVIAVGIGCTPAVEWLHGSGLQLEDGVVCDARCAAAPNVWAAGDVARWYHIGIGRHLRIEHRTNAQEQADLVARNILGAEAAFTPTPFFWSDQYDIKLQCAGLLPVDDEGVVEIGAEDGPSFLRAYYREGRLVGALGWNTAQAMPAYRRRLDFSAPDPSLSAPDERVLAGNPL